MFRKENSLFGLMNLNSNNLGDYNINNLYLSPTINNITNDGMNITSQNINVNSDEIETMLPIVGDYDKFIISPIGNHSNKVTLRLNSMAEESYEVTIVNNTNTILSINSYDKMYVLNLTGIYGDNILNIPKNLSIKLIRVIENENINKWSGVIG